jgi:hypothetical protein
MPWGGAGLRWRIPADLGGADRAAARSAISQESPVIPSSLPATANTPGNLITHLRKLEDAGYIQRAKSGNGRASLTCVTLTRPGPAALDKYTTAVRALLGEL